MSGGGDGSRMGGRGIQGVFAEAKAEVGIGLLGLWLHHVGDAMMAECLLKYYSQNYRYRCCILVACHKYVRALTTDDSIPSANT